MQYTYQKVVNPDGLQKQIQESDITIALVGVSLTETTTTVEFKAPLSSAEETTLGNIVTQHDASVVVTQPPLSVSIDQPKDSDGFPLLKNSPFADSIGFRFRGASFKVNITGNSTEDYDYLLTAERWVNGGCLIINNRGADDKVTFQVVDKDNLFGFGAGVVLDEFINDFYIPEDGKLEITLDYPARLIQGLYLRMKYTSTHVDGCTVKCNLYLHMKT